MDEPTWTVMIYLSGDNNLTEEMVLALKQLLRVPPSGRIKVVAQFDPSGLGVATRRFDFSKANPGGAERTLADVAVEENLDLGETNTGNPEALSDFIAWAAKRYDAPNKFLILSGHGSGAEEDFLLKDESAADSLTIPELQWALCQSGVPIRILGLDNCLMSTVEVVDSVSGHLSGENGESPCGHDPHVDVVIASEGFAPSQGWPYHRFLETILADIEHYSTTGPTVEEVVELVVDGYARFYSDYDFATGASADIAAIDVGRIPHLVQRVTTLAERLKENLKDPDFIDALVLAHWRTQTYKFGQYVDLLDFCRQLYGRTQKRHAGVAAACAETIEAVEQTVVLGSCTGPRAQHSHGLSLYFPWAAIHESYGKLNLPENTGWFEFILDYLACTRREARHAPPGRASTRHLVPEGQRENVRRVFEGRKRPELAMTLGLGYLEAPGTPSSYAAERNGAMRYVKSRYVKSRFQPGESDLQPVTQWIQNPPTSSGTSRYGRSKREA